MSLHLDESNPDRPSTIVWLHGGGVSGWAWREQTRLLPDFHHLVVDLPGHGRSGGTFTHAEAARQIAELIEQRAQGGRAHLVGLSLGAQLALSVLALAPERIERAVVSGALAEPVSSSAMFTTSLGRWLLRGTLALYMPFRNAGWLVRANMKSLDVPPALFDEFAADTRALRTDAFLDVLTANMGFRLPEALSQVRVPTLVLVGEREQTAVKRSAQSIAARMPNAQGRQVLGVGHNWNFEKPELFADTVAAWCEGRSLDPSLLPLGR